VRRITSGWVTSLTVVKVDAEKHLLFVEGAVPGPKSGTVVVKKQAARSRYA